MKKKIILSFFALLSVLCLFGCGADTERFFDYQDDLKTVEGRLICGSAEYGIKVYFEKKDGEKSVCRRIEYTSPESLSGLSFTLEGENITAELEGVRIANTWFSPEDVFFVSRLFSFSEGDIYEIKTKGESTAAKGKNEGETFMVKTDRKGSPTEIIFENGDVEMKLVVLKTVYHSSSK